MGKKHLSQSIIPKTSAAITTTTYINKDAASLFDYEHEGNDSKVFLSIRHLQVNYQCFSDWSKAEMKDFWSFNSLIHDYTWQDVYATARKKKKNGIAYTIIPIKKYPNSAFKKQLSPDVTLFELRISQVARAHGFRDKSIFYLCWLDRNHEITD